MCDWFPCLLLFCGRFGLIGQVVVNNPACYPLTWMPPNDVARLDGAHHEKMLDRGWNCKMAEAARCYPPTGGCQWWSTVVPVSPSSSIGTKVLCGMYSDGTLAISFSIFSSMRLRSGCYRVCSITGSGMQTFGEYGFSCLPRFFGNGLALRQRGTLMPSENFLFHVAALI